MADMVREYLENSLEKEYILNNNSDGNNTEIPDNINESESTPMNNSSYVLTRNDSQLSRDVDRWLRDAPTEVPQDSRVPNVQRSVLLSRQESLLSNSFLYLAALVLPIFNAISYPQLQCSQNVVFNSAGLLVAQFGQMCSRVRSQLRRMTENYASDIFTTTMDVILVVYAVGFLILSMYQAALIG